MMLNVGSTLIQWRPRSRMNTVCMATTSATADHLRQQLDSLHKEADNTRAKASNARLRLMRLSEAVEKLRRQAAVSVQTGKENDARELLFQKKKVMKAMEKLKSRIELFDELSAKLNEAISMKESLLIGNMSLDLEVGEEDESTPIRIISPTEESQDNTDDTQQLDVNYDELGHNEELQAVPESQVNTDVEHELNNHEEPLSGNRSGFSDDVDNLRQISTYEDFIKQIDKQLDKIEEELETFLRFSNIVLGSKENQEYVKVQHAADILESVRHTRERIATMKLERKELQ